MQNEKTLPYGKDCRSWGHSCSACPKMIFHDDCPPHDCGFRASDNSVPASVVDHADGDPLNNDRSNIRIINPRENLKPPALEHPPLRSLSEVAERHSPEVQDLISGAAEAIDYFTEDELEEYAATKRASETKTPPIPWTRKDNRLYAADGEEIVVATNASPKYRKVSSETAEAIRVKVNSHDALAKSHADLQRELRFMIRNWKDKHPLDSVSSDLTMAESALAESERI
jgi:HNH endonuclease